MSSTLTCEEIKARFKFDTPCCTLCHSGCRPPLRVLTRNGETLHCCCNVGSRLVALQITKEVEEDIAPEIQVISPTQLCRIVETYKTYLA